jgi:hypothetical protein
MLNHPQTDSRTDYNYNREQRKKDKETWISDKLIVGIWNFRGFVGKEVQWSHNLKDKRVNSTVITDRKKNLKGKKQKTV